MITRDTSQSRNPWVVRFRDEMGKQRQRSFPTRRLAEEFDRKTGERRRAILSGLDVDPGHISFDALCDLYLAGYEAESKAWFESMLRHSRAEFGRTLVRMMRPEKIQAWLSRLDRSPKTRDHVLNSMRQVLNAGVEWGYLTKSPARPKAVKGPSKRSTRTTVKPFESWQEMERVAHALKHPDHRALVKFIASTGLRTEEALALDWRHILPNGSLVVEQTYVAGVLKGTTKTNESTRTIVMTRLALDALTPIRGPIVRNADAVFTAERGGRISLDDFRDDYWYPALEQAGLEKRPPYQLRHTFATLALSQGCSLEWVAHQLGHTDLNTTREFYARFLPKTHDLQRALFDQMKEAA